MWSQKIYKNLSIYDIIEPIFSDNKGTIVSVISQELKNKCKDYELLPDTIINALNDGNRVLLINKFHFIVINSIYLYQEIRCDKYYFASYFLIINSGIIRYPFDCDKFRISLNSYICSCPFIIKLNLPGKQFEAYVSICCILIKEFQEQSIPETIEKDLWCRFQLPHI